MYAFIVCVCIYTGGTVEQWTGLVGLAVHKCQDMLHYKLFHNGPEWLLSQTVSLTEQYILLL